MGADFMYATFPRFEATEERFAALSVAIRNVSDQDWSDFVADIGEDDYTKEALLDDIIEACSIDTRETSLITVCTKEGKKYSANITGGMSWGDSPTEAFSLFVKAGYFSSIYELALQFAADDYEPSQTHKALQ